MGIEICKKCGDFNYEGNKKCRSCGTKITKYRGPHYGNSIKSFGDWY
jgi:uncharacterized membrane protein YvbJ